MNLEFALETPNFTSVDQSPPWWHIRPCTGKWWLDVIWVSVIAAIHQHVIPSVLGSSIPIDLITPWLVISFVVGSPFEVFLVWILGSMFLETASNAPKGLYLCSYWIVLCVLMLSRKTLSWKLVAPWLVTFFLASFWISQFETLVIFIKQDPTQLDFGYFFSQLLRVLIVCLIGMAMAQPWMLRFKGDRVRGDKSQT